MVLKLKLKPLKTQMFAFLMYASLNYLFTAENQISIQWAIN